MQWRGFEHVALNMKDRRVRSRRHAPVNIQKLIAALKGEWTHVPIKKNSTPSSTPWKTGYEKQCSLMADILDFEIDFHTIKLKRKQCTFRRFCDIGPFFKGLLDENDSTILSRTVSIMKYISTKSSLPFFIRSVYIRRKQKLQTDRRKQKLN